MGSEKDPGIVTTLVKLGKTSPRSIKIKFFNCYKDLLNEICKHEVLQLKLYIMYLGTYIPPAVTMEG